MAEERPERSLVLPAYNEAGAIVAVVRDCIAAGADRPGTFEVVVVDDGSTDNTAELVAALAVEDERVRLVVQPQNGRYAAACLAGIKAAHGNRIFIIDSDGQHDPNDLWNFDAMIDKGFDLVLGWRQQRSEPRLRLIMSRVLWLMSWWYLRFDLHDVNAGIRACTRDFGEKLEVRHRINYLNPELFVRARLGGFRVAEAPTTQLARRGGITSHNLSKPWSIFIQMRRYLLSLSLELKEANLL